MTRPAEISLRALGMMQLLASAYANGEQPEGPDRGIVDRKTALDAVMQLFAVIDEAAEAGGLLEDRGLHAMAMLMLVREHILALPDPEGDEALLRSDLSELVAAFDEARGQEGL